MRLAWTPDQIKIYNLLAEGKPNKEVVAAGFDKSMVSKVKVAMAAGETPPERKPPTPASQKPKITAEEGEHIRSRFKAYEKEEEAIIFIMDPNTSNIIDLRHKHPLIFPMYQMSQKEFGYGGSFDQFLVDGVESFFASQDLELSLAPKKQTRIYDEVLRLKEEGLIEVTYDDEGSLKLEVPNGDKGKRTKARARATKYNDQPPPKDEGGEEQSTESE